MTNQEITVLIDNKINENSKKVIFGYYEMKVKKNLAKKELLATLNLISIRLNNLGYKVYRTGQKYSFNGQDYIVETNVLMLGIKDGM